MMVKEERKIGITAKKDDNFSEWYTQVVGPDGAELADVRYGVQGFIVHMPWGFKIIRKIYEYLEAEFEADGHEPYLFPVAIKKENLDKEREHAGFSPDVYWVTQAGNSKMEEPIALRPTGETQIYPMYSLWIRSYSQLPFKRYQSRHTVYRNEKTTRPFLRGREFLFMESHDIFASHADVMKQIKADKEMMETVIGDKLKIPHIFFVRPKWDKFMGAEDTYVADTLMPDGKRNQLSSTHDLGQNFAKAFDIKFSDKDEKIKYAYQTCFGPGIWRIMAAIIGVHGDDKGLILPFDVAPIQIVIVPIIFSDVAKNKAVINKCIELEKKLKKHYRVYFDNSDSTSGWKFNQWEMKGVPIRIEVGPKDIDNEQVAVSRRTSKRIFVKETELDDTLRKESELLDKDIEQRAHAYFADNTKSALTLAEVKKTIKSFRGFVKAPFCSVEKDGAKCAEIVKAETEGAYVCGIPWDEQKREHPKKGEKCVGCGREAKHVVYIAKSW